MPCPHPPLLLAQASEHSVSAVIYSRINMISCAFLTILLFSVVSPHLVCVFLFKELRAMPVPNKYLLDFFFK
ncbi:rCG23178 [Rattus norvegicus]|uniref:RCG23178 n=1 Tax=Rattus norvegicus TaxID=10116 RepID=A6JQA2_RAT|nr:rCG23178 [Rattus norvegicus]